MHKRVVRQSSGWSLIGYMSDTIINPDKKILNRSWVVLDKILFLKLMNKSQQKLEEILDATLFDLALSYEQEFIVLNFRILADPSKILYEWYWSEHWIRHLCLNQRTWKSWTETERNPIETLFKIRYLFSQGSEYISINPDKIMMIKPSASSILKLEKNLTTSCCFPTKVLWSCLIFFSFISKCVCLTGFQ